ncbi:MAG: hypothetical protein JOZ69_19370 [Myxococcales bacterium]|nr:hypothetical protein [Myxococcales bacterium]
MDRHARADALLRTTLSLADAGLRVSYLMHVVRASDVEGLARALDAVCERAEQAEAGCREALLAIVDALNGPGMEDVVQRLREQAAGESLLALERLVRSPIRTGHPPTPSGRPPATSEAYAAGALRAPPRDGEPGRPLTLGERKSLARRHNRDTLHRLLADSHPDVIRALLRNPRLTEDDVLRLAARRPGRGEVLAEVARSGWSHRPRIRLALVMNPATPMEIAARIAGLLLRPELERVARSPAVPANVRALCLEHLERRPPVNDDAGGVRPDRRVH